MSPVAAHQRRPVLPLAGREPLGSVTTAANLVTVTRTLGAVLLGTLAVIGEDPILLAAAYATYWLGDMLDGLVARALDQETRLGAVLDIISDRACTSILCVALILLVPSLVPALVPFFLSFMVLDTLVSLSFLCWPLASPNHFAEVDLVVYRLNWSPPAKALNTSAVVILALAGLEWLALGLVVVLAAVKIWSGLRVVGMLATSASPRR